jgi:exopolysaccharide production protein ExoQ
VPRWYYWVAGFFLLDSMEAFGFIDDLVYGKWLGKTGDKITQSLNLLMILTSLMLFAHGYRMRRSIGFGGQLALATIGYLLLTALWSTDPQTTVREAIVYFFVIVGTIGIAATFDADEFMGLLELTCFLSAIASIALLFIAPAIAFTDFVDFQGIFPHKNFLGQVMATGALASLHGLRVGRRPALRIVMLCVFAGLAFASKSATAWLTIFVSCGASMIAALWQKGGAARIFGMVAAIALGPILLVVAVDPDPILELIGKDPTLTGRTEIWDYVISDIWLKPLLGWGYFAFWLVSNPAAMEIANSVKWFVPQAHNGLLEMLLNVGLAGTAIFIFLLARNIALAGRCLRTPEMALGTSTIVCCIGIFLVGVSENVLLAPTQSSTTVFFITGFMCEHALRAVQQRRLETQFQGTGHQFVRGIAGSARATPSAGD